MNLVEQNRATAWVEWPQVEAFPKPGTHTHIHTSSPLYLCPEVGSSVPAGFVVRRAEEEAGPFL